jgi:hypothetical protein
MEISKQYSIDTNESIMNIKNILIKDFGIINDFDLYFKSYLLNIEKSIKEYSINNLDTIEIIFKTGYIFLNKEGRIERILVTLDNINNIDEKIIDIKNYIDKLGSRTILKFNDKILDSTYDNLTLDQLGLKFNLYQNNLNTLYLI